MCAMWFPSNIWYSFKKGLTSISGDSISDIIMQERLLWNSPEKKIKA